MPAYHREATLLSIKQSLCKTSDKRRHMTRQVPPHRARLWQMGTTCVFGSRSKVKKEKKNPCWLFLDSGVLPAGSSPSFASLLLQPAEWWAHQRRRWRRAWEQVTGKMWWSEEGLCLCDYLSWFSCLSAKWCLQGLSARLDMIIHNHPGLTAAAYYPGIGGGKCSSSWV